MARSVFFERCSATLFLAWRHFVSFHRGRDSIYDVILFSVGLVWRKALVFGNAALFAGLRVVDPFIDASSLVPSLLLSLLCRFEFLHPWVWVFHFWVSIKQFGSHSRDGFEEDPVNRSSG